MTHERKARIIASAGAFVVRLLTLTLRFRVRDEAGAIALQPVAPPFIGIFWHNRLFVVPHLQNKFMHPRTAVALTSPSKDGEILAAFLRQFSIGAIRGSSSRRGAVAILEMKRALADGHDVAITPDGPRGPCYHMNPGVIALAQMTGALVVPVAVNYSRYWQLKSWDAFQIPKPFARVEIVFHPSVKIAATDDEAGAESERARLEQILRAAHSPAP